MINNSNVNLESANLVMDVLFEASKTKNRYCYANYRYKDKSGNDVIRINNFRQLESEKKFVNGFGHIVTGVVFAFIKENLIGKKIGAVVYDYKGTPYGVGTVIKITGVTFTKNSEGVSGINVFIEEGLNGSEPTLVNPGEEIYDMNTESWIVPFPINA